MLEWRPDLWLAVLLLGAFHGFNPGMGWPLAVSAGLMQRRDRAVFTALIALATGHFLAMALSLLPFSLLISLFAWLTEIRLAAAVVVIAFGTFLLIYRRHPRFLARVRPTQIGLWSFLIAIAHGAGLMLVPFFLSLCRPASADPSLHDDAMALMQSGLGLALAVALVHSLAMIATGGILAWCVYRFWGLGFLHKAWFNLDAAWALSLIATGVFGLLMILAE